MGLECVRCGNCCPKSCDRFEIKSEDPMVASCTAHGNADERGILCAPGPLYWYTRNVACMAVLKVLEKEDAPTFTDREGGQVFLGTPINK